MIIFIMKFLKEIINKRILPKLVYSSCGYLNLQCILLSKRMLVDHVEILEQCQAIPYKNVENPSDSIFFFGGLILSSMAVVSLKTHMSSLRYFISTAVTSYGCWFAIKMIIAFKNILSQQRLNETIAVIEKTDVSFRRNITFVRESQMLGFNNHILERLHDHNKIFFKSITEIIHILYAEVKILESISLPDYVEIMYESLEELPDCIYFEKYTIDHLKMLYNIFLYFQSQYFLRIYLILHFSQKNGFKYLNKENICFRKNMKLRTEKLNFGLNTDVQQIFKLRKMDMLKSEGNTPNNQDLQKMKKFSMDVFCRLFAITNKYQKIDEWIHSLEVNVHLNKNEMLEISNELNKIKDSIDTCQGDLETLGLISNKLFDHTMPIEQNGDLYKDKNIESNFSNRSDENQTFNTEEESQEYFGINICEDTENESTDVKYVAHDLQEDMDMKVTQRCFAPVLKQLKSKINPIKTEMKERELKYLTSKGMDRDKIIEFVDNEDVQALEQNKDHMETRAKSQTKSSGDRYNEARCLLQQKQQMLFMPSNDLRSPSSTEDILE